MPSLSVPSHVVEWAHIDAYTVLEMSHRGSDCMVATTGCEWNTLLPRIFDDLDYIVLTTWLDDSEVCWALVLSEAKVALIEARFVHVERKMDSRFAGELLLKLGTDCLCR